MRRLAISATLILATICVVHAQTPNYKTIRAMKGINQVGVLVENLSDGADKLGLTMDSIRTDVELKLRLAGMRVLPKEEQGQPGTDILYVVVLISDRAEAAHVAIKLSQDAFLYKSRDLFIPGVVTWEDAVLITLPTRPGIRETLKDEVDKFLNLWLTINPRSR